MRYFVSCSYLGTAYCGWQKQPDDPSIQQTIEKAISTFLRREVDIVGCGRTDAGVHARYYVFHFDTEEILPDDFLYRVNQILPADIALFGIYKVDDQMHARFSAVSRSYEYLLTFRKDPFLLQTAYLCPFSHLLDHQLIEQAAAVFTNYQEFEPFCKAGSDATHYRCDLKSLDWTVTDHGAVLSITANRFLRGMVRLITGTLLEVGRGKIQLQELIHSLETQEALALSQSAPAHGLALTRVEYGEEF